MAVMLESERLIFRDLTEADLDTCHRICSDARVMEFVGDGEAWPLETTRQFISRATKSLKEFRYCQLPLIHKADSALIGFCGFVQSEDGIEIGWRLAPEYWGQGLATEAASGALEHGFQTLGFQRVIATVQSANKASIRVIAKLGMQRESSFQRDGRELLVYSISTVRHEELETT